MATVSFEQVTKRFARGGFALRELNLTIADGELVCVVGPSGCGKSTTLNLLAGLEQPSSGRILIGDRDVTRLSPGERDVAMVFQSYALYPHLDVRGNLAFPLKVARLSQEEIAARVAQTAALLGLSGHLGALPRELSGGQRQRVALGRALVRRPSVFLFDEPLSNLDAALRAQMRGELKKLHERLAATFVYVTHDQAEAMTLADRVVLMRAGAVEQVGPPGELYARPGSVFAATFFGTPAINLVAAEALGLPPVPDRIVGIRPEDLEAGLGPAPEGALGGTIYLVEPMGADTFVTVERGEVKLTARLPAAARARSGEAAWVRPNRERLHWFDAATERRVDQA